MATYMIKSAETKRFVTTLGNEEAGQPVNTYEGSTLLTFSKALDGAETFTTIKGDSGLYIAPGPADKLLIWSEAEFTWNAVLTASTDYYELIPANGNDLFWTQSTSDEYYITLLPGSKVTGDEGLWKIYND